MNLQYLSGLVSITCQKSQGRAGELHLERDLQFPVVLYQSWGGMRECTILQS